MFALTVIITSASGHSKIFSGSLIDLPPEIIQKPRYDKLCAHRSVGWFKDDLGYNFFSKRDFQGNLIVVPGIIVDGEKRPKKLYGYDVCFKKAQIEKFVDDVIEFEKSSLEKASQDVNMLVHDLRNISNSIYNAAIGALSLLDRGDYRESSVRIGNIVASQTILKIRTDILDFTGNPASVISSRDLEIYRKVDKVCRSLKPNAKDKGIQINFGGTSYNIVRGPDIFEVVPFVLIENGVKYSPVGGAVEVNLRDDKDSVRLEVSSLGPRIDLDEHEAIFERGYRGRSAFATAIPGSGFGLALVKSLVNEHFSGTIDVSQNHAPVHINEKTYHDTVFTVSLPAHGGTPTQGAYKFRLSHTFLGRP